jgi:pyruvate-formate lyase
MSSVAIATLKPSPGPLSRFATGTRTASNESVASGCGAITSIRSVTEKPGASASTTKAESPLAPGASPVRAKTT